VYDAPIRCPIAECPTQADDATDLAEHLFHHSARQLADTLAGLAPTPDPAEIAARERLAALRAKFDARPAVDPRDAVRAERDALRKADGR